ncbi:MAG TPA: hypothetical protein P5161_03990 [Eubacteriales bacterium]|jgi:hypothetical protein|nr:hypothetical protein [Clostridia bacterium]HRR89919.1 hypothetical protein [Eubacteriales bacterium]HRU84755.1 hypothetical protein [Eubacteriales bacterium]
MDFYAEVYKYLRSEKSAFLDDMIENALKQARKLSPRTFSAFSQAEAREDGIITDFFKLEGRLVKRVFSGAAAALFMAVTLGFDAEIYIKQAFAEGALSGTVMDAVLSATAEQAVEELQASELSKLKIYRAGMRISPGFGDFSLDKQRDFMSAFGLSARLGLYLNDEFMLTPQKTVTAVLPLFSDKQ